MAKPLDQPALQPVALVCLTCDARWEQQLISNVPARVWIAHVKSFQCPSCGEIYRRIAFRTTTPASEGDR